MTATPTIGSSEIAVCVGLQRRRADGTPYTSALELWARLRGLLPRYDEIGNADTDAGNDMETGVGLRYAAERGLVVGVSFAPGPKIPEPGVSSPDLPWLRVRCDFLAPTLGRVVEVKCPKEIGDEWGREGTDEIAIYYLPQVMSQVAVMHRLHGWDAADVVVAARAARRTDRHRAVFTVRRDPAIESRLLGKAHDWFRRHVEDGVPPVGDGSESASQAIARIWRPDDTTVTATAEDVERWRRLLSVRSAIDELEAQRREIEQGLQARMQSATVLEHDGRRLATWRARKGADRIDLRRLRAERPDICREFHEAGDAGRSFRLETR